MIIPNALTDYARREVRRQRAAERAIEAGVVIDFDPTDEWAMAVDLQRALATVPNANLVLLQAMGYTSSELSTNVDLIDQRRSRARKGLARAMADYAPTI